MTPPTVSILMPTYGQAAFLPRAIKSLMAQTLADWELIVVDDGSPDATFDALRPFLGDARIAYRRLERNLGLGAALNVATTLACGRYLAYLPSDDLYYPEHLASLAALLDTRPEVYLAHAGLRWGYKNFDPLVKPALEHGSGAQAFSLHMVQVMHRRAHEPGLLWPVRDEIESDDLEGRFWARLAELGTLAGTGVVSCEWLDHAEQRSKLIAGKEGGLARYRSHYGIGRGEWVNWQPSRGPRVDERARYGRFAVERELPAPGGLRILLVGELGFNPERMMALEERGHKLYGLWTPRPETWDTAGPLPYGNIETIPLDRSWVERARAARPDVMYGLLNWQALELIDSVLAADLGAPMVFHFKEGPFICYEKGLWPTLVRVMRGSAGHIFTSEEARDWFRLALGDWFDPARSLVLDGDLPKADWFTNEWAPKLSAQDGQIHTVCTGRPLGLDPFEAIAAAGIHVHFYGEQFHETFPNWTRAGLATGYMHLHPAVSPANWVRELSRYDAAWMHLFSSANSGDLRRAMWDDLNMPARLGTYAAAGLPWIMRDNNNARVAPQSLAARLDVGLLFREFTDLAEKLGDRQRLEQLTANMRAMRHELAFDTHVDALVGLFRRVISEPSSRPSPY